MIRIGISGWRYAPWRGVFYPKGLAQRRELEYAAGLFPTVEINGTHYSLQRPEFFDQWYNDTPEGFVFAVKGSRFITHMKRLIDVERPLANFFASGIFRLREKLGPFLWQFPASFRYDESRFESFFDLLPRDTESALALARKRDARVKGRVALSIDGNRPLRHAMEIRHESFLTPSFFALLRRNHLGLVVADTAGLFPYSEEVTADFVYVRLHGETELYASGYPDESLERWAALIRKWAAKRRDVYCYFDNDAKVKAPFDALRLIELLGDRIEPWNPRPAPSTSRRTSRASASRAPPQRA